MGFFGRKEDKLHLPADEDGGDFGDSPVETVPLTARAAPPPTPKPVEEERPSYGIDQAIELMRALPVDQNVELVVQVIKTTLESLRVRVPDIIDDASKKQKRLEDRVALLKAEIADLEKEIQQRKEEIARHEADHSETTAVKARLELAQKAQVAAAAKKAPAAKSVT